MKIEGIQLDNLLYLKNNVTLTRYETNINRLISGKTEEKKIRILEGIKKHTDKILTTESNKYYNAEVELNKNQNHLNVVANGNFTLAERVEYLYRMYHNNKPLSEFDKTDISIRSEVLQTNVPAADSKVPADIEIMKRLVIKTTKILKAQQEVLKKEMKESARRISICNDAISFCDSKIAYLQTQIRNRKSAAQQKLNNAGQNVAGGQPAAGKPKPQPGTKKPQAKSNSFLSFSCADKGEKEADEDSYGKYFIEKISGKVYKVYYKLDENGYAYPTGRTEEIENEVEEATEE